MKVLVVTSPFGGHALGEEITDPREIAEIQGGENAGHVVASTRPDRPAAKPTTTTGQE